MNNKIEINFLGKRKLALVFSLTVLFVSIASLAVRDMNLGIDFTGGTSVELLFDKPVDSQAIRDNLSNSVFAGAKVQDIGSDNEVLIRLPVFETSTGVNLDETISSILPGSQIQLIDYVGPQVSKELADAGILALVYAMGGILIYIVIRFTLKFAIGAIAAILHDVIITVGFFSVFDIEIDLTVLAAVLAVIGYSLNDTIVVFDRIRENFRLLRKDQLPITIINRSLNQTLSRTLVTSGTTLLVVMALFLLGGEMIRGFSTALAIGIVIGTYSSIYVASTALIFLNVNRQDLLMERKEEG